MSPPTASRSSTTRSPRSSGTGQGGTDVFFQNELPYDPPSQAAWNQSATQDGYPAFEVGDDVKTFHGYGMGSYVVFIDTTATLSTPQAFEAPEAPGVQFHDVFGVWIAARAASTRSSTASAARSPRPTRARSCPWTWRATRKAPPPRWPHALAFHPQRRMVIHKMFSQAAGFLCMVMHRNPAAMPRKATAARRCCAQGGPQNLWKTSCTCTGSGTVARCRYGGGRRLSRDSGSVYTLERAY